MMALRSDARSAAQGIEIESPIGPCRTKIIDGTQLGIIRSCGGNGMVDGIMKLVPGAKSAHRLYRDPVSLQPV
jgi:uracil phosphoribosyltransferase